ncbi:hypothetical protein EPO34_01680 [Patescibacteria group bacterium]|nr:MAG: hypothetical protein EPO34_01680 [Patescibacteria group bacterium]
MCGGSCACAHHKVGPLLIALIGLLFLLKTLGVVGAATVDLAWPVALIVIGLMKSGMCKCCK